MISSPHVFRFPQLKYVNISYLIFSIIHLFTSYRIIIIIQTEQQLPVGLKAQLVEQCCAITWLWVWAPFKPVFSGLISSQLLKVPRMLIFFRFFLMWLFITKVNLERSAGERLLTCAVVLLACCSGFISICFRFCPTHPLVRARICKYMYRYKTV